MAAGAAGAEELGGAGKGQVPVAQEKDAQGGGGILKVPQCI